jgi:glycosyltransferase involved in cell wall biosynthesis
MTSMPPGPLRVLHVMGGLDIGGVETWLFNLVRRADRSRLAMDFLLHNEHEGAYEAEVRSFGSEILRCPRNPLPAYLRNLWSAMRSSYDVVHSHVHAYSGWILSVAALARVPVRIAHSHLDTREQDLRPSSLITSTKPGPPPPAPIRSLRRAYVRAMKGLIRRHATAGFAASHEAGRALFGDLWGVDPRWSLLRCGIDTSVFEQPARPGLREELGIGAGAFVIGHVGRFEEQKNHAFLVPLAREIARVEPAAHFLLVGDGPLRSTLEKRIEEAGLRDRFTLTGQRRDVAALMVGAMDAFVLPSLYEGLPLVLVEAQAAGLPCLVSDTVSPESSVVEGLVAHESLQDPPETWAACLSRFPRRRTAQERWRALKAVQASPFDSGSNLALLHETYARLRSRVTPWK